MALVGCHNSDDTISVIQLACKINALYSLYQNMRETFEILTPFTPISDKSSPSPAIRLSLATETIFGLVDSRNSMVKKTGGDIQNSPRPIRTHAGRDMAESTTILDFLWQTSSKTLDNVTQYLAICPSQRL